MSWFEAFLLGQPLDPRPSAGGARFLETSLTIALVGSMLSIGCQRTAPDVAAPERAVVVAEDQSSVSPPTQPPPPESAGGQLLPAAPEAGVGPASTREAIPAGGSPSAQEMATALQPLLTWIGAQQGQIYAALLDLEDHEWLVEQQADRAVNVASNAKLVTAAAALSLLGPDYQFSTELFGSLSQGKCERLVLRGGGAPDLSVVDLQRFVSVLRGRGLLSVGQLVVDQSQFSGPVVPPAFEQQPEEWAPFRANISALSLDANVVTLNVFPTRAGEAARVWYEPAGAVTAAGQVLTSAAGSGDGVAWQLSHGSGAAQVQSKVAGKLAVDAGRRRYQRRWDDPRMVGGWALRALLEQAGVEVGNVQAGVRQGEARVAAWSSRPMAELVRKLGKESDNFTAEMLLVALSQADPSAAGEQQSAPWSSQHGAQVVDGWLRQIGVWTPGTVVKNGSGLFDANRYSPKLLVALMAYIEGHPEVYYEFMSQLAIGATDGTMKQRMHKQTLASRIRAKTGTLRDVDALGGYITRSGGRPPLAFSLVVVGGKAAHADVRKRMDQTVLSWAQLSERIERTTD